MTVHGLVLVTAQFALIGVIAYTGYPLQGALSVIGSVVALLLGAWAVASMRFRVRVFPEPRSSAELIVHGPYQVVRHPMYTSVLLLTLSWVAVDSSLVYWVALVLVLLYKLRYEEKLLSQQFPGYSEYCTKTKRIVPFLY